MFFVAIIFCCISCQLTFVKLTFYFEILIQKRRRVRTSTTKMLNLVSHEVNWAVFRISISLPLSMFPNVEVLQGSISSTFYSRIFHTKIHSNPNSKKRKSAQKNSVQKIRAQNVGRKMLMKLTTAEVLVF